MHDSLNLLKDNIKYENRQMIREIETREKRRG